MKDPNLVHPDWCDPSECEVRRVGPVGGHRSAWSTLADAWHSCSAIRTALVGDNISDDMRTRIVLLEFTRGEYHDIARYELGPATALALHAKLGEYLSAMDAEGGAATDAQLCAYLTAVHPDTSASACTVPLTSPAPLLAVT